MIRRLHRVSSPIKPSDNGEMDTQSDDALEEREYEAGMAKLELLKWRVGLQRMLASHQTMERQKGVYEAKVKQTGTLVFILELDTAPHICEYQAGGEGVKEGYRNQGVMQ